jgi:pimeloyl-ACP methyl ester carboxylesterase
VTAGPDPLPAAVEAGWVEHWLARPQGRLRFVLAGQGPPLILCHGFIGSAENFETWVPVLAARRTLVMPDLPGFGGSDPLPGRHVSRALASEVRALADHLGLESYEAAGLCLGAAVALELMASQPGRVTRMLLHTPLLAPAMVTRPFRLQVAAVAGLGPWPITAISAIGRWRMAADLYRRLVVEGSAEVDRRSADVNFANQLRASPRAAREWLGEATRLEFTRLLDGWGGRADILAAADDRILDISALRGYCEHRPRILLHLLQSAGHGWTKEFMAAQQAVLEHWVEEQPGRA